MIKLESNEQLYFVKNCGCDDTTHGLAIIQDDDFPKFEEFIQNLNKNSTYGCMPIIEVYKVDASRLREATEEDDDYKHLYLNGKAYTSKSSFWGLEREGEKVI